MAQKTNRRKMLGKGLAAAGAAAAVAAPAMAQAGGEPVKKIVGGSGRPGRRAPLFSRAVTFGNLVFVSGIGYHEEGDIKVHTAHVLDELQKALEDAGSSMEKVLKVNVYLNSLDDYDGMNEVYRGRFGAEPGVRTTIAAAGGIPGNSLVEIDCIACL